MADLEATPFALEVSMFTKILVPLDGSTLAEQAIGPATAIARASRAALELVLVHDPLTFAGFENAPWEADASTVEREYLEKVARELRDGASISVSQAVLQGAPSDRICEQVRAVHADLVVLTSHGRTGLTRAWMGSVANDVLRRASVPVLVIRPADETVGRSITRHLFKRILVTLDGSPLSMAILPAAKALARCNDATLVLLRVIAPVPLFTVDAGLPIEYPSYVPDDEVTARLVDEAERELAGMVGELSADGIAAEFKVVASERVARAIADVAAGLHIDAIAMSTHGRGMSRLFLGSVADKVLRASDVPLLLQRPVHAGRHAPLIEDEGVRAQLPALSGP